MRLLWAGIALLVGLGILSGVASVLGDMSTLISGLPSVACQVSALNGDAYENDDDTNFERWGANINMYSHTVEASRVNGGFVFTNVLAQQGLKISSAYITVYIPETGSYDDANVDILGNDVDDANNFDVEADVTSRTRTTASVPWVQDSLGVGWKQSPDISAVVQEIVNRGGWASGNDLCILVDGKSDINKEFKSFSYDAGASLAARLSIEYESLEGVTEIDKAFWAFMPYIITAFLFIAVLYILLGKGKSTSGRGD